MSELCELELSVNQGFPYELFHFTDGEMVYAMTDYQEEIVYNGVTYTPAAIKRDAIGKNMDRSRPELRIVIPAWSDLAMRLLSNLSPTAMAVVIRYGHTGMTGNPDVIWTGQVSSSATNESEMRLVCVSTVGLFQGKIGRMTTDRQCGNFLYDELCKANKAAFSHVDTVTAVTGRKINAAIVGTKFATDPTYFANGYVQKTSGLKVWIRSHEADGVTLMSDIPGGVAVSDSLTFVAGCDYTRPTCKDRFANIVNHNGWESIPDRNPWEGRGLAP